VARLARATVCPSHLPLSTATTLAAVVAAVKAHLRLAHVQVALPAGLLADTAAGSEAVGRAAERLPVTSFAVCAGSGASVLSGVRASVYVTGEMSHHEVLAAAAEGTAVILTNHSNCERGYLPVLADKLSAVWHATASASSSGGGGGGSDAALPPLEVVVSAIDADPLVVV
jgi:putative NIF3 family GTP cyclohydrolase 1 type 2